MREAAKFRRWITMTIPKKGRRSVRVGDTDYAWRIRKNPTYSQGAFQSSMTLAIQPCADNVRSVLVVNLKISRPDNWVSAHQTAVKPSMIRDMIARSLAGGWQPFSGTGPFLYEYPVIMDRA
jgi:hypothetical protein